MDQIPSFGVKMCIHGDLPEKISDLGMEYEQGAQSVKQIVKSEKGFSSGLTLLVGRSYKGSSQLQGIRNVLFTKKF